MKYFVYILKCADGTYYTGIAKNLESRVIEHNEGERGAKYTRGRKPVRLVYSCVTTNKSEALKLEIKIKKLSRTSKELLIKGKLLKDL